MKIVLDTNVLLVALSHRSPYRSIFDAFLQEDIQLCVTTDILVEYEEIIGKHLGKEVASNVLQLIENAINVEWIIKYFKWNLVEADPNDNKFVDCAIAANAKYLVSEDKHFNILKQIPFPKVELLKAKEFVELLEGDE
ncbi:MAG: putative toxin-antitoxin system toxin component, PIN family [Bacteroidota bacterium]